MRKAIKITSLPAQAQSNLVGILPEMSPLPAIPNFEMLLYSFKRRMQKIVESIFPRKARPIGLYPMIEILRKLGSVHIGCGYLAIGLQICVQGCLPQIRRPRPARVNQLYDLIHQLSEVIARSARDHQMRADLPFETSNLQDIFPGYLHQLTHITGLVFEKDTGFYEAV